MAFWCYMLRCRDDSFYVGHTDALDVRIGQHTLGLILGYTHSRRPIVFVWSQEFATREEALSAERQLKGWGRRKKEALIVSDWRAISRHSWGTKNPLPDRLK